MNQKGLAPVVILLIIAVIIGTAVIVTGINRKSDQSPPQPTPVITSTTNENDSPIPASFSKQTKPTQNPSRTPKPTPTHLASTPPNNPATPTNPYDLNSPTGAVKVIVKPQSGDLAYTPQAELSAVSGFKVLDGRSTDKITRFGPQRNDNLRGEIIFSTAPPGPYKVRISYNGVWSDQKDVTVSSASQSTVEFTVAGQASTPTPAPTPIPKSTCQVNIVSKSSESAPSTVNLAAGAPYIYKPANLSDKYITAVKWDYDGDGSWDTDMSSSLQGITAREYTTGGTHTVNAQVQLSDGEITDTCSNSFSLN